MAVRGWATGAEWRPQGSELTAAVTAGATTLPVEWTDPFDDEGGILELNGERLIYIAVDEDASTLTLSVGPVAGADVDDPVLVVDGGQVMTDYVLSVDNGEDETIEVDIPFGDRDLWPEGVYSDPVPVLLSDDLEKIEEVPGRAPVRDGAFIDPPTLPPAPTSDGDPPAEATTVTVRGGIGSLAVTWTEIDNADPVTYRLHLAADGDPATDGTDEVVAGVGVTAALVRSLPNGDAVIADGSVTYHAIVTVEDTDGPGPASTAATGIPAQVTGPDIAAEVVTADFLMANDAFIGALNAIDMSAVTMTAPTIQTDTEDQKGIKLGYDVDGNAYLRAWGPAGGAPFFDVTPNLGFLILLGEATLNRLTTVDRAELNGLTELSPGSTFRMVAGVTAPTTTPSVGSSYSMVKFNNTDYGSWNNKRGLAYDSVNDWYFTFDLSTLRIEKWSGSTGNRLSNASPILDAFPTWDHASVAYGGGKLWLLVWGRESGDRVAYYYRIDPSDLSTERSHGQYFGSGTALGLQFEGLYPAIGYAEGETNPLRIIQTRSGPTTRITLANFTGSFINTPAFEETDISASYDFQSVLVDDGFDFGDTTWRYVVTATNSDVIVLNLSGDQIADERWPTGVTQRVGIAYDGTQFQLMSRSGWLRDYTQLHMDVAQSSTTMDKWASVSYARSSGPWESDQSEKYFFENFPKRSQMSITGPELPASPGSEEPDELFFYVGSGSTEPADAAMYRQTGPGSGVSEVTFSDLVTGTANPNAGTPFPTNGNAEIVSEADDGTDPLTRLGSAGGWRLAGDCDDDTGDLTASGSFTGTVQAMRLADRILITGFIARAASFSTAFSDTGVVLPTGYRPSANRILRPGADFNSANTYRFQITTGGVLQIAQSAAIAEDMMLNDVFKL